MSAPVAPKLLLKLPKKRELTSLDLGLEKILQALKLKDPYNFFAEPVDVSQVTDYLAVIKQPMDFGTMERKIRNGDYASLDDFIADFGLVVRNCKTYNSPVTPYYKTAEKLENFAAKLFAKERQPLESGSPAPQGSNVAGTPYGLPSRSSVLGKHGYEDDIVDIVGHGPILPLADASQPYVAIPAPAAAKPLSKYLRKKLQMQQIAAMKQAEGAPPVFTSLKRARYDTDGSLLHSVALKEVNILPTSGLPPSFAPTLGSLHPHPVTRNKKLASPFADQETGEKRFPILYVEYDPYASFGPVLDSAKITSFVSAEEHDFLSVTYGDVVGEAYMNNLEQFTRGSPAEVKDFIHRLLDSLSVGTHRTVKEVEAERAQQQQQDAAAGNEDARYVEVPVFEPLDELAVDAQSQYGVNLADELERVKAYERAHGPLKIDQASFNQTLCLLRGEGIDLSFILAPKFSPLNAQPLAENPIFKDPSRSPGERLQAYIDDNAKFVAELQRLQRDRFSRGPAEKPSQREVEIVGRLRARLVALIEAVPPRSLISKKALHYAMPALQPNDPIFLGTLPPPPPPKHVLKNKRQAQKQAQEQAPQHDATGAGQAGADALALSAQSSRMQSERPFTDGDDVGGDAGAANVEESMQDEEDEEDEDADLNDTFPMSSSAGAD